MSDTKIRQGWLVLILLKHTLYRMDLIRMTIPSAVPVAYHWRYTELRSDAETPFIPLPFAPINKSVYFVFDKTDRYYKLKHKEDPRVDMVG